MLLNILKFIAITVSFVFPGSSSTSMGTPKTPKSQRTVVSSQSTPGPVSQDSASSATQLSGIEEMDDDFDMDAAEQSMNLL